MKRLPKKEHVRFAKQALALFIRMGFQKYPDDVPGHDLHARDMRIMTDLGVYCVHLPDAEMNMGDYSHDINGRFETVPARGDFTSDLYKRLRSLDANYFSGKWNLMGNAEVEETLELFEARMGLVNARPPTPEEAAQWAADDAIKAAKLAVARADWKDYLAREDTHTQRHAST
jgi:hypothetical protein